ncbi:hypothetical protein BH10PSE16_BH10PSE16_03410 [soil metagenome]
MFSDQVKKVDKLPSRIFLSLLAAFAFMALLAALVQVASAQVKQAHLRQAQYSAAQAALSNCSNSYSGTARRQCVEQVNASLTPYSTYTPETEMQASDQIPQLAHLAEQDQGGMPALSDEQSFMPAKFSRQ